MTVTGKIFWFADRVGLFSIIGTILHSLVSLSSLIPFGYIFFPNMNVCIDNVSVGFCYLVFGVYSAYIINILLSIWSSRSVYHGFIKLMPTDKLLNLWLLFPGVVLPLSATPLLYGPGKYIIEATSQNPYLALIIFPSVGFLFLITPTIIVVLVVGTPCAYITELASYCRHYTYHELHVQKLVENFKSFQRNVSAHLFVVYSLTTVQLILNLYQVMENVCKNTPVVYHVLNIVWILGMICWLGYLSVALTNTYNNVMDVEETLRLELKLTKPVEKRQLLESQIRDIQSCQPFTALGFYTIDRSTLTATLGTILTYCIILFQTVTC